MDGDETHAYGNPDQSGDPNRSHPRARPYEPIRTHQTLWAQRSIGPPPGGAFSTRIDMGGPSLSSSGEAYGMGNEGEEGIGQGGRQGYPPKHLDGVSGVVGGGPDGIGRVGGSRVGLERYRHDASDSYGTSAGIMRWKNDDDPAERSHARAPHVSIARTSSMREQGRNRGRATSNDDLSGSDRVKHGRQSGGRGQEFAHARPVRVPQTTGGSLGGVDGFGMASHRGGRISRSERYTADSPTPTNGLAHESSTNPPSSRGPKPSSGPRRDRSISTSSNLPRDKLALDDLDEEEKEMLSKGMVDWREVRSWTFWIRREWLWYYVGILILGTLVVLMTLYHQQIVGWLTPATTWMKDLNCGWLIPIGVMIVLSIPPLFGQEIVCVLCGLVWGLWIGFGIIAAGTFFGELLNFYMFQTLLRGHAIKMEKEKMNYALMAHVIREGGIVMAIIVRMSAIPGHFTTAVFSTCGMGVWTFCIACILTLPKQLVVVYLGVALEDVNATTQDKITKYAIISASVIVTILAAWYIYWKMNKARLALYRARRAQLMTEKGDGLPLDAVQSEPGGFRPDDSMESLQDVDANPPIVTDANGGKDSHGQQHNGDLDDIRYIPHETMSVYAVDDMSTGHADASGDLSAPREYYSRTSSTEHLTPTGYQAFPDPRPHQNPYGPQSFYKGDRDPLPTQSSWGGGHDLGYSNPVQPWLPGRDPYGYAR